MKQKFLAFVCAAIGSAGLLMMSTPAVAQANSCGSGAAVVVAGTNATRDSSGRPTGGITGAAQRYSERGYHVTYVDYPTDLWPLGAISYDDDVRLGKIATERAVSTYQSRCPGMPVVILGYSQGARIAGDVLSDAGNGRNAGGVRTEGLSGELYSDPRRGGRGGSTGVENALIGLIPGITLAGPRSGGFGNVPVREVCVAGDGVCDVPDPLLDPVGAADGFLGYFVKHGYYPARMRRVPATGSWPGMSCIAQGATQDCLVKQPSSASLEATRISQQFGLPPKLAHDVATGWVDHRAPLVLSPVPLAEFRPLVGGRPDSHSGDLSVRLSAMAAGVVGVDAQRTWGTRNELTLNVAAGVGMVPTAPILDDLLPQARVVDIDVKVPLPDTRMAPSIALNPSRLMGASAPIGAIAEEQRVTAPPTTRVQIVAPHEVADSTLAPTPDWVTPQTPSLLGTSVQHNVKFGAGAIDQGDSRAFDS